MTGKRKIEDDADRGNQALERDVHEALKAMGWLMPESEAEVQPAEGDGPEHAAPLPAACPITAQVSITRVLANARWLAEIFRPAIRRLSTFFE